MKKEYRVIFLLIFFISGFSGLIYESIWTQYLKLFLGHAAYAQTLVLIIFMGGMAIGSYLASRYSNKWLNLFRAYAIAEGIIGILALVFHESFISFLDISYDSVLQNLETPLAISIYKLLSSSVLILPQSILLGTTFPLMSAAILRSFPSSPGKNISLLYFTNSIGAAIGVLISGFIFIKAFGLPGTIKIAGILNIFIALIVLFLAKRSNGTLTKPILSINESAKSKGKIFSNTNILLSISAFTGMASFIYEIGWIRMLNLVLGTSTHAFELMLSAFIFGLAFGGFWIRKRIDKMSNPFLSLGYIQIIMGILALSTLLLYNNTFNLMEWLMENLDKNDRGYFLFNLSSNGIAFLIMFPATFCAGMTLPIITTILLRTRGERSIGSVYAWNTIGGIIGVIFSVHIGMPIFGLKGLICFGAGIDILLGIILLFFLVSKEYRFSKKIISASVGIIILFYIVFIFAFDSHKMASGVYRGFSLLEKNKNKIMFNKDGKTATVSIILHEEYGGILSLRTNGKSDASLYIEEKKIGTIDESTMIQTAVIPMALNSKAEYVANIGLGAGTTTKTVLANPNIESVVTVEIEEEIVNAAKKFGSKVSKIFSDPRSLIVIDDAKSFFASTDINYDIILSEPSNPWVSGVSGLFSVEFYKVVNKHLNNNGIFAQWIQLYNIDIDLIISVLKSVSQSFSDYNVYLLNNSECLIVAKKEGLLGDLDENLINSIEIKKSLKHISVYNKQDILFRYLGNKELLDPFLDSFSIIANSDYYPVLDQNAAQSRFLKLDAKEIYSFTHHYHPVIQILGKKDNALNTTKISLTQFYAKSKEAKDAMDLYNYFVNDIDLKYSLLSENIKLEAILTKNLFKDKIDHLAKNNRLPMLLNTSIRTTPYLSSIEMEELWNSLGVTNDYALSLEEKVWMNLFRAISQRDSKKIVTSSETILTNYSIGLPTIPREYLISAAMIGYILEERFEEAQVIWELNKNNISDEPKSKMLFRFLLALSKNI